MQISELISCFEGIKVVKKGKLREGSVGDGRPIEKEGGCEGSQGMYSKNVGVGFDDAILLIFEFIYELDFMFGLLRQHFLNLRSQYQIEQYFLLRVQFNQLGLIWIDFLLRFVQGNVDFTELFIDLGDGLLEHICPCDVCFGVLVDEGKSCNAGYDQELFKHSYLSLFNYLFHFIILSFNLASFKPYSLLYISISFTLIGHFTLFIIRLSFKLSSSFICRFYFKSYFIIQSFPTYPTLIMFNHILQISNKSSNQHNSSASTNLFAGLSLIGKVLLTTNEWNQQFSQILSNHLPKDPSSSEGFNSKIQQKDRTFSSQLNQTLRNFSLKECHLCKKQQSSQNFYLMCKCQHKFCYSCLNVYAITKINDQQRVKCPEPTCPSDLRLSSEIYKNLPQIIKLKYLQWRNQNKAKKIDLTDCCSRCLQKRHSGACKVPFSKQNIESAFKYRKCYKCQAEANIEAGIKQVHCASCGSVFCYVCGETWPIEGDHSCLNNENIFNLEQQVKQSAGIIEKNQYGCQDSECLCFKNTGKCVYNIFYCKRCQIGLCLGNALLLPIRFIGSAIVLCLYVLMLLPLLIVFLGWIITGIVTGATCYSCELIGELNGGMQVIAILGFPIFMFGGIFMALRNLFKPFAQTMNSLLDFYQSAMCQMWIQFGPKECCT